MMTARASSAQLKMVGIDGEAPVLIATSIKGIVLDALSEMTITQTYRNDEQETIEAVYTFPLPLDAILLDLTIRLGEKQYQGQVMPRRKAEKSYEKAIIDGDSAIMLECPQPGTYTMNVGNLKPSDVCVITFRYGMFNHWQGDTLRISLPTVIAPRYGDPAAVNLLPHQIPVTNFQAEHDLSLNLLVQGSVAKANIATPSHEVTITRGEDSASIELAKGGVLDCDFILEITASADFAINGYFAGDGQRTVAWVPFHPVFSFEKEKQPIAVTVVVDCSGSMQGDSIAQARTALLRIVEALGPQDYFGLITFGSQHQCFAEKLLPADAANLKNLYQHIEKISADMGGTELGSALNAAYRLEGPEGIPVSVLLITDGQVSAWQKIASDAQKSGQRVFTVGVGSAVTEAAVRGIAEKSGGACEMVSPREDMAGRIFRHFLRMQSSRCKSATISWAAPTNELCPENIDRLYSGDTLHQCAWFKSEPGDKAQLTVALPEGGTYVQEASLLPFPTEFESDTLARLVAGYRLREDLPKEQGEQLAMDYRLISQWTNYCAVIVSEDGKNQEELPKSRQVPQMWPAGGHGLGTVLGAASSSRGYIQSLICDQLFVSENLYCKMPKPDDENSCSSPSDSYFWELLRSDSLRLGKIISALPFEIRNNLVKLSRYGLHLEDVEVIFLVRLFEHFDPSRYSRKLSGEVRNKYSQILIPQGFDSDRLERTVMKTVYWLLGAKANNTSSLFKGLASAPSWLKIVSGAVGLAAGYTVLKMIKSSRK